MINIDREDLNWLAGLFEGEACFHWKKDGTPLIILSMTDLDVVEKVRDLMRPGGKIHIKKRVENQKTVYRFTVHSGLAIEWMRILQPLMFIRRRTKITEILELWEGVNHPQGLDRTVCSSGHDLIDPNSYYVRGSQKRCKICLRLYQKELYDKDPEKYKKKSKLAYENKPKRGLIKAIAINRKISLEEAKLVFESLINGTKEIIQ